jgi:hypothetical protein
VPQFPANFPVGCVRQWLILTLLHSKSHDGALAAQHSTLSSSLFAEASIMFQFAENEKINLTDILDFTSLTRVPFNKLIN